MPVGDRICAFPHEGDKKSREGCRRNQFSAIRKAANWSRPIFSRHPSLSRPSRHFIRGLRTTEPSKKDGASFRGVEVSRVRKGCESSSCLCSCCRCTLHGAFEALLLMIMVFCRLLLLCIRARREEGKEARTTDARKVHGRTATQAYKGRNLIPFFHPLLSLSLSGFFVLPSSLSLLCTRVPVPRLRRCRRFSVSPLSTA